MKRMMHPQHGFHHPMNSLDRENMLKNGWVDEPEANDVVADPNGVVVDPAATPAEPIKRKPGRPRKT